MTINIRRPPRRDLAHLAGKPTVLEVHGDGLRAARAARYLLIAEKTLRNRLTSGDGPRHVKLNLERYLHLVTGYRIADLESWISEHITGPGQRHQYFPVDRVGPAEVARHLGKSIHQLEDMRRDNYGPPWLKLSRVVSYWIPEVVQWAEQRGIHSNYVMRPAITEVIVHLAKPPLVYPPEIVELARPRHG